MRSLYGDSCPGTTTIYKWSRLLKQGRESLDDDDRLERSSDVLAHKSVMEIKFAVMEL